MAPKREPVASPWYDLKDMERLFQVNRRTVWVWVSCGRLPEPVRRTRKWVRWPRKKIDRLIREWSGDEPPSAA